MIVMIMVMIVMIMVMIVLIMAMIVMIMVMNVMVMAMIVMIMVMNVMIRVMNVMIMVMIFVQSKFGGLLKTRLLLPIFLPKNWTNLDKLQVGFLTDFGRFCLKCIMHACRLGWPFGARTATLDGRSSRRPLTGDKEKYHYKDHKGSKEDIEEKKTEYKKHNAHVQKVRKYTKVQDKNKNFFLPTDHKLPSTPPELPDVMKPGADTAAQVRRLYFFSPCLFVCFFAFQCS